MRYDTLIVDPIRDMTTTVVNFIPTLLVGLGVIIIGWVIARTLRKLLDGLFGKIQLDKIAGDLGLNTMLRRGGIKHKLSQMLSCFVYCIFMVMVLIVGINAFGITLATDFIHTIFAYIPHVVVGTMTLVVGMLLAKVVSGIVYFTAKNTDMPIPETLRDLSKLAIVVYVTIVFLREIGFVSLFAGASYTLFMAGIIFAIALAFGLAGKDIAAKYLDVLKK